MLIMYISRVVFLHTIFALTFRTVSGLTIERGAFIQRAKAFSIGALTSSSLIPKMSAADVTSAKPTMQIPKNIGSDQIVAYRSFRVPIKGFGVEVPVAVWYPSAKQGTSRSVAASGSVKYAHSISVRRIGQLLCGWNLPSFLQKSYDLSPFLGEYVVEDSEDASMLSSADAPVIVLAHGYLGSRFDMCHLAECLAQEGFVCISPEYPESLAASYERMDGLERSIITPKVMETVIEKLGITGTRRGIVGHSLGCGTAINTGDRSWARVCIAGYAANQGGQADGAILFISSVNDGAVPLNRLRDRIPSDFVQFGDDSPLVRPMDFEVVQDSPPNQQQFPLKTAVIFERRDAPNHISFLSDGVNNAMIDLLSPLLPVAQALKIPVLDFDKYKISQDSAPTAEIVIPMVRSFLKQNLLSGE